MQILDVIIKEILSQLPQQKIDWGTKLIGADRAWEKYRGKNIKIGIIDTGIDYAHPDLAPNVALTRSYIDDTDGFDSGFHGTHVAGIFGGADTGIGIIGVAPQCDIYSAKIFGKGNYYTVKAEEAALEWLASENVHVINMSYGGLYPLGVPGVEESLERYHALIKQVHDAGIIMVAATGNSGNPRDTLDRVSWPARFPEVFAVGAICQELQRAEFSSAGPDLDFAMPGVDVYSCYPHKQWARFSGTSMAAPYLTGCVALLQEWAMARDGRPFNYEEVKKYLVEYATDLGVEGVDVEHGHGYVNIGKIGVAISDSVKVQLDQPMILDPKTWRTLAPLRFLVEVNGGRIVSWDTPTQTVVFETAGGKRVTMQVDNPEVTIEK